MRATLSKEITDRLRACLFVLAALWHQGPSVAAIALDLVRPSLEEGDKEPDLCRYAGKDKLAEKVRASTSRPGRTAEEPEDVTDDALGEEIRSVELSQGVTVPEGNGEAEDGSA